MEAIELLRGDSLVWTVTFWRDTARTIPWDDIASFAPRVQVRADTEAPDSLALVPALSIVGAVLTLALTRTQSALLKPGVAYVWDVQLTDPEAAEGLGDFTWPPAPEPRCTIEVGADVTRIAA